MVDHIGAKATQTGLYLPAIGVFAQVPGESQQAQGVLEAEVLGLGALGERGAFGLGVVVTDLAPLHIGPVLAEEQIDQITGLGIFPEGLGTIGLLLQDQLRFFGVQIRRGDLVGQGGFEQLLAAVFRHPLGFEIGAKTTDPHHAGETLEGNRA